MTSQLTHAEYRAIFGRVVQVLRHYHPHGCSAFCVGMQVQASARYVLGVAPTAPCPASPLELDRLTRDVVRHLDDEPRTN